jgi:hypothetical protein
MSAVRSSDTARTISKPPELRLATSDYQRETAAVMTLLRGPWQVAKGQDSEGPALAPEPLDRAKRSGDRIAAVEQRLTAGIIIVHQDRPVLIEALQCGADLAVEVVVRARTIEEDEIRSRPRA